jgi:protein CWC15
MVVLSLQDRQQAEEEAKMKEAELMRGNPLININNPGSFSIKRRLGVVDVVHVVLYAFMIQKIELLKRLVVILTLFYVFCRWDDDVVFKNQARGETKTPKRFINDTIRSDFHRKFLQRYMK